MTSADMQLINILFSKAMYLEQVAHTKNLKA